MIAHSADPSCTGQRTVDHRIRRRAWPSMTGRWPLVRVRLAVAGLAGLLAIAGCGSPVPDQTARSAGPSAPPSAVAGTVTVTTSPSRSPSAASATPTSDRLVLTCQGGEAFVDVSLVVARADGVHVLIRNPFRSALDVVLERTTGESVADAQVEQVETEIVVAAEPGRYAIGCGDARAPLEVIDPAGHYVSRDLSCGGSSGTAGTIDYGADARGPRGALLDVARRELRGLRPGDVVERAGYPAGGASWSVRVVRAGLVVAVLSFEADGHGGWLLTGTTACGDSGVTAEPPG